MLSKIKKKFLHKAMKRPINKYFMNKKKQGKRIKENIDNRRFPVSETPNIYLEDALSLNEDYFIEQKKFCKQLILQGDTRRIFDMATTIFSNEFSLKNTRFLEDNRQNIFFLLYLFLHVRSRSSKIMVIETFDSIIKFSFLCFEEYLDDFYVLETCKFIEKIYKDGLLLLNKRNIIFFLFQAIKKKVKLDNSTKIYIFKIFLSLLKDCLEEVDILINELYTISNLKLDDLDIKSLFIIEVFKYNLEIGKDIELASNRILKTIFFEMKHYTFIDSIFYDCIKSENMFGKLFLISFVKFFFANVKNDIILQNGYTILLETFKNLVENNFKIDQCDIQVNECYTIENSDEIQKKMCRSIFSYLIEVISSVKHIKKIQTAKALIGMNLKNLVFTGKTKKRLLKVCRSLLKDKLITMFECGVHLLKYVNHSVLISELTKLHSSERKYIIFKYVKSIPQSDFNDTGNLELIYRAYLELIQKEENRELEFKINDYSVFSRVFYSYHDKRICKFLKLDEFEIHDIFTADLCLNYSKYNRKEIDVVYISSFLIDTDEDIFKSKKILFYIKIIQILTNLHKKIAFSIKKRLLVIFKKLLFYSPYTKYVGFFLERIQSNNFEITCKNDYILVILASCNHQNFIKEFTSSEWSPNKERALIYILRFHPNYFNIYKWKLEEIIKSITVLVRESDGFNLLELLCFLTESFELEESIINNQVTFKETYTGNINDKDRDYCANSYYNFINDNISYILECLKSSFQSLKLQSYKLLTKATINKALLPQLTIPYIISYHRIDYGFVKLYEKIILNNINDIITYRLKNMKRNTETFLENVNDYFIYNLYSHIKNKEEFIKRIELDGNIVRTYVILINIYKTKYSTNKFIYEFMQNSDNKILSAMLTKYNEIPISKKRNISLKNIDVLLKDNISVDDIEFI